MEDLIPAIMSTQGCSPILLPILRGKGTARKGPARITDHPCSFQKKKAWKEVSNLNL
jgi:hypothetical protein